MKRLTKHPFHKKKDGDDLFGIKDKAENNWSNEKYCSRGRYNIER